MRKPLPSVSMARKLSRRDPISEGARCLATRFSSSVLNLDIAARQQAHSTVLQDRSLLGVPHQKRTRLARVE